MHYLDLPFFFASACELVFSACTHDGRHARATSENSPKITAAVAHTPADSRDADVLQTLLSKIVQDPEFTFSGRIDPLRTNIILIATTPKKFGMAQKHQIEADTHRAVPSEEFSALELRNRIA